MAKKTAQNLPKLQVVSLDNFSIVDKAELTVLANKYKNLVVNNETYNESKKARLELRNKRYEIQNIQKDNKALLNSAKKVMDGNAEELIGLILPVEEIIDARLKEIEAEKERIKAEKEAERLKIQAERIDKIGKIQSEFTSHIINLSTLKQADELKVTLLAFKVTDKEFGDLKLSCEQTITNLRLSIVQARERIEKEIEAEKQLRLDEAKNDYKLESGEEWDGEDNIDQIQQKIADVINSKAKTKVINEYHELGGEVDIHDEMTLDDLIGHLSTLKFELTELAKKVKAEILEAKKVKGKLAVDRMNALDNAGIDDFEWVGVMLRSVHPNKMIEDLTDVEFETFLGNLIAINAEITEVDFEEIPVEDPILEKTIPELGELKTVQKEEDKISIVNSIEATIHYVETNEYEYNFYTRHSPTNWTVAMGESDEPVYDCVEIEALFQEHIKAK